MTIENLFQTIHDEIKPIVEAMREADEAISTRLRNHEIQGFYGSPVYVSKYLDPWMEGTLEPDLSNANDPANGLRQMGMERARRHTASF